MNCLQSESLQNETSMVLAGGRSAALSLMLMLLLLSPVSESALELALNGHGYDDVTVSLARLSPDQADLGQILQNVEVRPRGENNGCQ